MLNSSHFLLFLSFAALLLTVINDHTDALTTYELPQTLILRLYRYVIVAVNERPLSTRACFPQLAINSERAGKT